MKQRLAELQTEVMTKKLRNRKRRNPYQWAYSYAGNPRGSSGQLIKDWETDDDWAAWRSFWLWPASMLRHSFWRAR